MLNSKYVFISYSSVNKAFADTLRLSLMRMNIDCWMNAYDIPGGSNYAEQIIRAIRKCSFMALILSDAAQKSEHVNKEIDRAVHYDKRLFPIQIEDFQFNDAFEYYLGNCQIRYVKNFSDTSAAYQSVLEEIRRELGSEIEDPEELETMDLGSAAGASANSRNKSARLLPVDSHFFKNVPVWNLDKQRELALMDPKYKDSRGTDPQSRYVRGLLLCRNALSVRDYMGAVAEFKHASNAGHGAAQYELAKCYEEGKGVPMRISEGLKWLRESAERGYPQAQYELGLQYYTGKYFRRNPGEAAKWLKLAAQQGHMDAMEALKKV